MVSGNYRRRAIGQGQLAITSVCPPGFEACSSAAGSDGYECVDTETELGEFLIITSSKLEGVMS
jgi:hypothetical protein